MEITLYEVKCKLCEITIRATTEKECREALVSHIDNDCTGAKWLRELGRKGIYRETIQFLRIEELEKKLRRLLKKYTIEEVRRVLEVLEED